MTKSKNPTTHRLMDKAMEIIRLLFNENINERFILTIAGGTCKIKLPLSVSLLPLQYRNDVIVSISEKYAIVTIC